MLRALHYYSLTGVMTAILFVLLATACRDDDDTLQGQSELKTLTIHFTDPNDISQRTSHREVIYVSRQSGEVLFCTEFDDVKTEVYEFDGEIGEKFNVWVAWIDLVPAANVEHAQSIEIVGYMEQVITADEEWSFTGVLRPRTPETHESLMFRINTNGEEVKNLSVRTSVSTVFRAAPPGPGLPYELSNFVLATGDIIYVTCQNGSDEWMYQRIAYEPGANQLLELDFSEFEPGVTVDLPQLPMAESSSVSVAALIDDYANDHLSARWSMRTNDDLDFSKVHLADDGFDNYWTTIQLSREGETHYLSLIDDHLPAAFDFEDFTLAYNDETGGRFSFQGAPYSEYAATWIGPDSEAQHPTYLSINLAGRNGIDYVLAEIPPCVLQYSSDDIQVADLKLRSGAVHNYDIYAERTNRFQHLFEGAALGPSGLYWHHGAERIRRFKSFR